MPGLKTALPPQAAFYHAVLKYLSNCPEGAMREDVLNAVPDVLKLNDEQKQERLRNLPHLRYRHRSGFALSELKKAGLVENPERGRWRITEQGIGILLRYPEGFEHGIVRSHKKQSATDFSNETPVKSPGATQLNILTPEEEIESALNEIKSNLQELLLNRILQASPMFFEMLVLDLMQSLGYGAGPDDIEHVGGVRDGGIDGIISLDKLGFDKVCIQAKRWQGPVGRPDVQAFYGALAGRKTVKGVMLTTSSFTREAIEFADQMGNIVLIDGKLLAALMIDHGVGVGFQKAIKIPRLDEDYFNND